MDPKLKTLESLVEFVSMQPCRFCIVFCVKRGLLGSKLRWCGAVHRKTSPNESYDTLIKTFRRIARHCYRWDLTFLIDARRRRNKKKAFRYIKRVRVYEADSKARETDADRRSWWYLVVGSG